MGLVRGECERPAEVGARSVGSPARVGGGIAWGAVVNNWAMVDN